MIRLLAIVAIVSPILMGVAHAENPQLVKAREAIDGVRYDDAKNELDAALASGTLEANETADAYRLLGNTLAVMGQPDAAEQAYRRYLALDPQAELPTTAPAKQKRPFQAAQAYIAASGALVIDTVRTASTIDVTITRDSLRLAKTAALGSAPPSPFTGPTLLLAVEPTIPARVIVRDAAGNALVEIEVPVGGRVPDARSTPGLPDEMPSPPLYRHWLVWAVPAVALGAFGTYYAFDARSAQDDLTAIAGTHGEFFASEFADAEAHRNRSRLLAGVFLGAAAACAVTSVIMLATTPSERRVIAPTASSNGAGIVFHAQF